MQVSQIMWRPLHHEFSRCQVVIEDMLSNDTKFLKKMADAVDALFRSHGPLQAGHHPTKLQEKMVAVVWHCQNFSMHPSKQNYTRLRSSWADLGVRERQQLRKAVHLSEIARNTALLELSGMSVWKERPFLVSWQDHLSNPSLCPARTFPWDPRGERGACRCDVGSLAHIFVCDLSLRCWTEFFSLTNAFSEVCP